MVLRRGRGLFGRRWPKRNKAGVSKTDNWVTMGRGRLGNEEMDGKSEERVTS